MLAAYAKPVSQSMKKRVELGWKPLIFISPVSAQVHPTLSLVGLENTVGVMSAGAVRDPTEPTWHADADAKAWLAWLQPYCPKGDTNNASNAAVCASGAVITQALKSAADDLSRENILKQMTSLREFAAPMLLPGSSMTVTPDNHNSFRKIELLRFDGKRWVPLGKPIGE